MRIRWDWMLRQVVAVAYERWSPTRGSTYRDLTEKILEFWKSARWREVVAQGGSTVLPLVAFICFQTTGAGDEGSSSTAAAGRGSILPTTGAYDRCWEQAAMDDRTGGTETRWSKKQVWRVTDSLRIISTVFLRFVTMWSCKISSDWVTQQVLNTLDHV